MSSDEVLRELSSIARADPDTVQLKDKIRALELVGKHHGLFTENVRMKAEQTVKFVSNERIEENAIELVANAKAVGHDITIEQAREIMLDVYRKNGYAETGSVNN